MSWNKRDFVAMMQAGKDRAQTARNRGQHTGKAAKGWIRVTDLTRDEHGPTDEQRAHAYGVVAVELAIEDHMRELFPARYEAFA